MKPVFDDPVTAHYRAGIDLTLLRENLKLTHEERLRKLQSAVAFAETLRQAGQRARAARLYLRLDFPPPSRKLFTRGHLARSPRSPPARGPLDS